MLQEGDLSDIACGTVLISLCLFLCLVKLPLISCLCDSTQSSRPWTSLKLELDAIHEEQATFRPLSFGMSGSSIEPQRWREVDGIRGTH